MSENLLLEALRSGLNNFMPLDDASWNALVSKLKLREYQKNDIIEKFNSKVTELHFVLAGTARCYFLDENNNEVTIWFSQAGDFFTDYAAFTRGETTIYQIQALTTIVCYSISSADLDLLYDEYKLMERLGRLMNQKFLNDFIERNNLLLKSSAKQKFDNLWEEKPHFFNEIPLKYIASYLGITVETLSRLRSNTY